MRLLFDEHIAIVVAQRLRERGHDVVAVGERAELYGAADPVLLEIAVEERRAIATYDMGFRALARRRFDEEAHHFGLVLLGPRAFPQGERHFGRLISALDAMLAALPEDDALMDREWWPE
ncbi:MAG: DUF5615 family PIN-like protein [Chloroflexi bacterium]|nr:DUF5615 family PIN-like protein [Chloroflexota bacterium]